MNVDGSEHAKPRILYLHSTHVPPSKEPDSDRFFLLSGRLEGDVLQPIWFRTREEVEQEFGPDSYPSYKRGSFRYHWHAVGPRSPLSIRLWWFYISTAIRLHRERRYDCIITYSHMTMGLCGVLIKLLTGVPLIIEVVCSPENNYLATNPKPAWRERLMQLYSHFCLHVTVGMCDRVHLLAPALLRPFKRLRARPTSVFHNLVPVSAVGRGKPCEETFILLVGAPWHLKGVDLLVEAFRRLSPDFPGVKLQLLGFYSGEERARASAAAEAAPIEILKVRPHAEVLELISRATIFVLPSRSEGMGRVIIEAMSAGIPVVGSDAGGIPYLVRDGETGLLFPSEDVGALETCLRRLLSDPELRSRMGARAYELAHTEFSEAVYVDKFAQMVESTMEAAG